MRSVTLLFHMLLCSTLAGCTIHLPDVQSVEVESFGHLSEWRADGWRISGPLTVEEIEARELKELEEYLERSNAGKDVPRVPFGFANEHWRKFKSEVRPDDEIYKAYAPPERWASLTGWGGYILVRDGRITSTVNTVIN